MAIHKICVAFALILVMYIFTIENPQTVMAAPSTNTLENIHRHKGRPLLRFLPKTGYPRLKTDFTDFIVDDDDLFEFSKRQTSDDYGHLRFGKRGDEQFDDYGHMRFGRSGNTE